jgi:hypothetical protein
MQRLSQLLKLTFKLLYSAAQIPCTGLIGLPPQALAHIFGFFLEAHRAMLSIMRRTLLAILLGFGCSLLSQTPGTRVNAGQVLPITLISPPKQSVTTVTASTPNSFPLPAGAVDQVCIVTRNIAQSPGVDYTITNGVLVFTTVPSVADVVQLNCW